MAKAQPHYLKTRQVTFPTKGKFKEHLQAILHKTTSLPNNEVEDQDDIFDLIDFLEDYHNESITIQEQFDLENCIFYVDKPQDYNGYCFWLMDKNNQNKRQFSITSFGNPRTPMQNLVSCFGYIIREMKARFRKEIAMQEGKDFKEYDLWNEEPKPKELVLEFIKIHNLKDKLHLVVSPNGLNNNAPYLMPDYEYLAKEYQDFYFNKKANDLLKLELRPRM
ncbi:hypothetical protein SAMN02745664_102171 [Moraxella cuniculi DSM 21768]|uniref:Uncharacterized protein n=1 Tax=Moraxella cuniculi DSM 21768 TaxID=1122245 RepID=A0A1N7DWG3_9GAMM|nr:hypothetical protein [Moraxella cuniculi]OOS07388.1 hypothetical protein B0189_02885 [Moraxella cuniculi]SIR80055.1 hypothetical protein SAMN02745664_102171 [Moraxella cuniculi DSM 21768]